MTEVWEKYPDEPSKWYTIFATFYLPLGPDRSIEAAYRAFKPGREAGRYNAKRPSSKWSEIAQNWEWRSRAEAWDARQREEVLAKTESERKDMLERHIKTAMALQNAAIQRLRAIIGDPDNGIPGEIDSLTPDQVLRYLQLGIETERQARGVLQEYKITFAGDSSKPMIYLPAVDEDV